ncbi:MAG: hypothetical protein LUQ26_13050 [Methylococcaceae bacterium]|nr:hypothetical protein [Methylococcaceae bacterium]
MGFVLKQISNVGSANPIVARLSLQFHEIIAFYDLADDAKEKIGLVLNKQIQQRLLACEKIAIELNNEITDALKIIREMGLKTQSNGRVLELPHIIGLEERIEPYLYNAKSCLRDILKIFNIVFGTNFNETRYDLAIKWASEKFGAEDALTIFLKTDHDLWIHKIIRMRNAIEHPGGHSGLLKIQNFEVKSDNAQATITEPSWNLNDEIPTLIRCDIHVFVNNILEFAEDVVISALEKVGKPSMLAVQEIPKDQRHQEAPVRFKIGLVQEL